MANRSYNHGAYPPYNSFGNSTDLRTEFDAVETGFAEIEGELDVITSVINAPGGTAGVSTTSLTVGSGSQSFTTNANKAFSVGQTVVIARTSAPDTIYMIGVVTSYTIATGAMTVKVSLTGGSGTYTDWSIGVSGGITPAMRETATSPAIVAGAVPIDCYVGNAFRVALNANITSFTMTNIPATGALYGFMLKLTADGTPRTITWSFSGVTVKWAGAVAPTLTSTNNKIDEFAFWTEDGGASWFGAIVGQNY